MTKEKDDLFDEMFNLSSDFAAAKNRPNKNEIEEERELTERLEMAPEIPSFEPVEPLEIPREDPPKKKGGLFMGLRSKKAKDRAVSAKEEERLPEEKPEKPQPKSAPMPKEEPEEYATSLLEEETPKADAAFYLEGNSEKIYITKPVFTIGIRETSDFVLLEDKRDHKASRHHATLYLKNDTCYVKDFSSNGTYIGDREDDLYRLPKEIEVEVRSGQYIKFANKVFRFRKEE